MLKLKIEADVEICFDKEVYEARILDPTTGFEEKGIKIEVRVDPLTRSKARVIPRVSVAPLGISDVNYFEKAHWEIITVISPEDLAQKLKEI